MLNHVVEFVQSYGDILDENLVGTRLGCGPINELERDGGSCEYESFVRHTRYYSIEGVVLAEGLALVVVVTTCLLNDHLNL